MRTNGNGSRNSHSPIIGRGFSVQPVHLPTSGTLVVPLPPALPGALIVLQLLLSNQIADLKAIVQAIRSDVGLVIHLMRFAAEEAFDPRTRNLLDIDQLVVNLGLENLRIRSKAVSTVPSHSQGSARLRTLQRFSRTAQLTALIAEELAAESATVRQEDAYTAGLLRNLGALPLVLGWQIPELQHAEPGEIGYCLAKIWNLPDAIADAARGDLRNCSRSSAALLDLVNTADAHAFQLQMGYE